jgi:alkanesulfonate monooxygenase SsuD/methylene tetrahydromethanopterin reductase-like flavin-dependent oxidoreductase (luciferase family)
MRYAVNIPNLGPYADPTAVADLARVAEDAGWDGFFVWDHVTFVKAEAWPAADPWVLLTAVALATARIRIGPLVTPLARRRMSVLARQSTTVDRLSGGRLVQGVGLGWPVQDEFGAWGEPTDLRALGARLDESLEVLTRLWTGEEVTHRGRHLTVDGVRFRPTPVQQPRIPVWVAGTYPHAAPVRRAARWDGLVPIMADFADPYTPEHTAELHAAVTAERPADAGPFDLVVSGSTASPAEAAERAGEHERAGATWWQEPFDPWGDDSPDAFRARIAAGPV